MYEKEWQVAKSETSKLAVNARKPWVGANIIVDNMKL